jgi:MFS family permease
MNRDITLLFTTRILRLFGYGFLSVILALFLTSSGFTEKQTGLLFTLALVGDAFITLAITTNADRLGRRKMLILGALLIFSTGTIFASVDRFWILAITAVLGVISPSGNEIGPFLSIEQSALTQSVPPLQRTKYFAWYSLAGSLATALGALAGGMLPQFLQSHGSSELDSLRAVLIGYAIIGLALGVLFLLLSREIEATASASTSHRLFGLHRSGKVVLGLSSLFAVDAFGGGFIVQSLLAFWFYRKFHAEPAMLGTIFFFANLLAGVSALTASRLAARFGLINTMVFTHIPSNILLLLVPLMPSLSWAIAILLIRFSISQMDVPTRQSYTMAVVHPDERSSAAGITTIARSVGSAISPSISAQMMAAAATMSSPFFLAGGLKILYDLALYISFRALKPPEELGEKH